MRRFACGAARLIPAHAGKTLFYRWLYPKGGAHPRSRGENFTNTPATRNPGGSSPLTRGKLHIWKPHGEADRLIPAHAGKTDEAGAVEAGREAHPRSRGENLPTVGLDSSISGSSPLTRGKPGQWVRRVATQGLIPAHAGKTASVSRSPPTGAAHPRSLGENRSRSPRSRPPRGSSPLTRGKHISYSCYLGVRGLIPAHAGKTRTDQESERPRAAHPRSRGENSSRTWRYGGVRGSSPLTRGKRGL